MHRLLARQLQKTLGGVDGHSPEVMRLIEAVNAAYHQADQDREMLERSMEISSSELVERNTELTAAEEKFRSIFETATEGIFQLDTDRLLVVANPAMAAILGAASPAALLASPANAVLRDALSLSVCPRLQAGEVVEIHDRPLTRLDGRSVVVSLTLRAQRDHAGRVRCLRGTLRDVTARYQAEAERQELHARLVDASRRAGMAEMATGVLHNVGNVLNSMNVSAAVLAQRLGTMKIASLDKAARMLHERPPEERGAFIGSDDRGRRLPDFFLQVASHLQADHAALHAELAALQKHLEHVKSVVAMQQGYARATSVVTQTGVGELLDEALKLQGSSFDRHGLEVLRQVEETPRILVDRHLVLQILVNLLNNAKQAMTDVHDRPKRLVIRAGVTDADRVYVEVQDTGVGIAAEHLTSIFTHGFTTKSNGHGFGLHMSANAARSLGGSLTACSGGKGQGATFRLELPVGGAAHGERVVAVPLVGEAQASRMAA